MPRIRNSYQAGITGAGAALSSSTSGTSQAITGLFNQAPSPALATLAAPDIHVMILEPGSVNEEVVYLTAYTSGSLNATIARGMEGTAAVAHAGNVPWEINPRREDFGALEGFSGAASVAPTVAAAAGAGTAPPTPTSTGNAARGTVSWGTGTGPAAGNQVTVTFATPLSEAVVPMLTPYNAAAAALLEYVTNITAAGFTIATQGAPAASQAAGTYVIGYTCDI